VHLRMSLRGPAPLCPCKDEGPRFDPVLTAMLVVGWARYTLRSSVSVGAHRAKLSTFVSGRFKLHSEPQPIPFEPQERGEPLALRTQATGNVISRRLNSGTHACPRHNDSRPSEA
jgi:hypothetical protein